MSSVATPLLFIHGLWLHSSSWDPWVELFSEAGYAAKAPGWPGALRSIPHSRSNARTVANHGINEVVDHYTELINRLPAKPILVGHSFGGMVAQKLLGQDKAVAVVAIDAAQIKGTLTLPLSALKVALPLIRRRSNRSRAVSLTRKQFQYAFGNTLTVEESDALYEKWSIPAPAKPLFEAAAARFSLQSPVSVDTKNESRGPLLLIGGGQDHAVPKSITRATFKLYRGSSATTDLQIFPDRGHSLTIDSGWRDVADATLGWLEDQNLRVKGVDSEGRVP